MYIFAEPVTETQIQEIQSENDAEIAAYEQKVLGLHHSTDGVPQQDEDGKWATLQADVEKEMDKDEVSMSSSVADNSVPSVAFKIDHPELNGVHPTNQGPLWKNAQPQSGQGEPITTAPVGVDMDGGDEKELELSNESNEEGLNEEQLESPETSEHFRKHNVSMDEGVEEITTSVTVSEKGNDIAHREETLYEAANGTHLEEPNEGNEGKIFGDAVNADTEQLMEQDTGDDLRGVQQTPENDSSGTEHQDLAPENEDHFSAADVPSNNTDARAAATVPPSKEVLVMTLTIRNKVNGSYVHRPENLSSQHRWSVEYAMAEVGDSGKAWNLYQASQTRRAKALDRGDDLEDDEDRNVHWYLRNLRELSKKGQEWRRKQDKLDRERPRYILGQSSAKGETHDVDDSGTDG